MPKRERTLLGWLLQAVHVACDQHESEVALALLRCCETVLRRNPNGHAAGTEGVMVAACYARVWQLRRGEADANADDTTSAMQ